MKLKAWDLGERTEAQLVAVSSPDAHETDRQWRCQAYFLTADNEVKVVRVPWGVLPRLRPGGRFVGGYLTSLREAESEIAVFLKADQVPQIRPWQDALHEGPPWTRHPDLQTERCLVFDDDPWRIVVPCVQIARAFHAQSRLMSHALLRPTVLSELATAELTNEVAILRMAPMVPSGVATKSFAKHLARLFFDPAWTASFQDVFHRRFADAQAAQRDPLDAIPLCCLPPLGVEMKWHVSGLALGGTFLVLDVLQTLSRVKPPYKEVRVIHAQRPRKPKRTARENDESSSPAAAGDPRPPKSESPTQMSRPVFVRQRPIDHDDHGGTRVFDEYPGKISGGPSAGGSGGPPPHPGGASDPPRPPPSFDEERKGRPRASAEFHAPPGTNLPGHFTFFMKEFGDAAAGRGWTVSFEAILLGRYVPDCQPADRLVLFARVLTTEATVYLVELEPLRGESAYTLSVRPHTSEFVLTTDYVGNRLKTWLNAAGRSQVIELLKSDEHCAIRLTTHRDFGSSNWVKRLLAKIEPRDARRSWTRGVAS